MSVVRIVSVARTMQGVGDVLCVGGDEDFDEISRMSLKFRFRLQVRERESWLYRPDVDDSLRRSQYQRRRLQRCEGRTL